MRKVYLDNGSTSFPKAPGVGQAMSEFIESVGCNIGRGGYESSYTLAERISETRESLRDFFCFEQDSGVIFTPNVTHSLNLLIAGLFQPQDHVIISSMEHNAVARPMEAARKRGVSVSIAPCDEKGRLDLENFQSLIRPETKGVLMLHASNVCGTILPLKEVGNICRERGILFIVDAAQTAGVLPIDMGQMKIDALAFTGHKGLLGPQGIGGLLIGDHLAEAMPPLIHGGTGSASDSLLMPEFLPDKFEAGTMNIPGILGLKAALDYINEIGVERIKDTELKLTETFIEAFRGRKDVRLMGLDSIKDRCPIVSLDFFQRDNAEISYRLDEEYGIMTRCGLHCAPMAHRTLGTFPQGTVRFAFGHWNTEEEVYFAIEAINSIIR
jgi:cysteine desulfurase family protein